MNAHLTLFALGTLTNAVAVDMESRCVTNARIVLLIDVSGDRHEATEKYFELVDSLIDYLSNLSAQAAKSGNAEVAIVIFGLCAARNKAKCREYTRSAPMQHHKVQRPFGKGWETLEDEKESFRGYYCRYFNGSTATGEALDMAREMLNNKTGSVNKNQTGAILLTDGLQTEPDFNSSGFMDERTANEIPANKAREAVGRLRKDGHFLYTILFVNPHESVDAIMPDIALPGRNFSISDPSKMGAFDSAFSSMIEDVCHRDAPTTDTTTEAPTRAAAPIGRTEITNSESPGMERLTTSSKPTKTPSAESESMTKDYLLGVAFAGFGVSTAASIIIAAMWCRRRRSGFNESHVSSSWSSTGKTTTEGRTLHDIDSLPSFSLKGGTKLF